MTDTTGLAESSSAETIEPKAEEARSENQPPHAEQSTGMEDDSIPRDESTPQEQKKSERERLFDFLRKEFSKEILKSLPNFDGQELAKFKWKVNDGPSRTFSISCDVNENDGATDFHIHADDRILDASFGFDKWGLTHTNDELKLWYEMPANSRKPLKIYEYQNFQKEKEDETFAADVVEQNRRHHLPDVGEFARLWLVDDRISQEAFVHDVTRQNRGENVLHDGLRDVGPQFENGRWMFTHPDVEVAIKEDGGFDIQSPRDELGRKLAAIIIGHAVWRLILRAYEQTLDDDLNFPGAKAYALKRPVNLKPDEVLAKLEEQKLYFPWHVINAACTSMNAGKNVIFTGPPGCGKTKLAVELAEIANGTSPVLATASPAWNNDELIGRYLPEVNGDGLVFEPGFFLKAVNDGKWLIIDELNRADIDRAFGELFSVLAGDTAELPYRFVEETSDDEEERPEEAKRIRIIPHQRAEDAKTSKEAFKNFHVAQDFRLLGTMNDADRSQLHQLSYALQRRFNIIRVEAPPTNKIKKLIHDKTQEFEDSYGLSDSGNSHHLYFFRNYDPNANKQKYDFYEGGQGPVIPLLVRLCAQPREGEREFGNLVDERIIGVATVIDIIRFVAEGLRAPTDQTSSEDDSHRTITLPEDDETGPKDAHKEFVHSLVAMAVALSVFPQLDAHADSVDKLLPPVRHIMNQFRAGQNSSDLTAFRRIEVSETDSSNERDDVEEQQRSHRNATVKSTSSLHTLEKSGRINDYLARELALHLGAVGHDYFEGLWEVLETENLITQRPDVV